MADEEKIWICKLCQTVFNDIYSYADHLESKEHVKGIMKKKYAQKYLEAKAILDEKSSNQSPKPKNDPADGTSGKTQIEVEDDSDEDEVYTCEICAKICTGLINYQLHLSGSKHKKRVKENKILKELKGKKMVPIDYKAPDTSLLSQLTASNLYASSDLVCEVCNVRCTGPRVFKQHCNGEAHRKKVAMQGLLQEMEDGSPTGETHGAYSCELCQKAFSGVVPYKQHLESLSHLKQKRDMQRLDEVRNLCITSPDSSKLVCKECNKCFSGSAPFEEHLKSSLHGKLKKKLVLYEKLEKNHPEMVKTTIKEDSDSEDSDNGTIKPACAICNMIFSGPEAAMDHFSSSKHKKTLKKKQRIEKYKKEKKSALKKSDALDIKDKKNIAEEGESSDDSFEKLSSYSG